MDEELEARAARLLRVLIERFALAEEAEARAREAEHDALKAARRAEVMIAEVKRQGDEFEEWLARERFALGERERAVMPRR